MEKRQCSKTLDCKHGLATSSNFTFIRGLRRWILISHNNYRGWGACSSPVRLNTTTTTIVTTSRRTQRFHPCSCCQRHASGAHRILSGLHCLLQKHKQNKRYTSKQVMSRWYTSKQVMSRYYASK